MTNVLSRIKQIQQPRGGLINPKELEVIEFNDNLVLSPECISPMSMGLMIDYLTRWRLCGDKKEAFSISISGGRRVHGENGCYESLDKSYCVHSQSVRCRNIPTERGRPYQPDLLQFADRSFRFIPFEGHALLGPIHQKGQYGEGPA